MFRHVCHRYPKLATLIAWSCCAGSIGLAACDNNEALQKTQRIVARQHIPRVSRVIRRDIQRHTGAVNEVAKRIAPGFEVPSDRQEQEMRIVLRLMSHPKKGVSALVGSPKGFVAAVDTTGKVIARDVKDPADDQLKGLSLEKKAPSIRSALGGGTSLGLGSFEREDGVKTASAIFAAAAVRDQKTVGAAVVGIPLWRWAQRLTRQLQIENTGQSDLILWVYLIWDGKYQHFGTPPELDDKLPPAGKVAAKLQGYKTWLGSVDLLGRPYALAARRVEGLDDVAVMVVRSDPQ